MAWPPSIFFAGVLFKTLPGGFLPDEDQGVFISSVRLPDGASIQRNLSSSKQVQKILQSTPGIQDTSVVGGLDIPTATNNSNVTTVFATLKPWDERKAKNVQFESILGSVQQKYFGVKDGFIFAFGLPPILGLGTSGGFEFMLEDRAGGDVEHLAKPPTNLSPRPAKGRNCKRDQHIPQHCSAIQSGPGSRQSRKRWVFRLPTFTTRCRRSWAACT